MKTKRIGTYTVEKGTPFFRLQRGNRRPYFELAAPAGTRLDPKDPGPWIKARVEKMRALIAQLRRAGHKDDVVERFLTKAGLAKSDADIEDVLALVDDLCADRLIAPENFSPSMTFGEIFDKWAKNELHQLYPDHIRYLRPKTAEGYESIFKTYLKDTLGPVPVCSVDKALGFRVMQGVPAGPASNALRRNVGICITRPFRILVWPMDVLKESPFPRGFLPKKKKGRAKEYLYPKEDQRLMACTEIPLVVRLFYGMLAREGLRVEELNTLELSDLDLENGILVLDRNKTADPRKWALDPGVAVALRLYLAFLHPEPKNPKARLLLLTTTAHDKSYMVEALRAWVDKKGYEAVADRLGLTYQTVYAVVTGKSSPGPKVAAAFDRVLARGVTDLPALPAASRERTDGEPLIAEARADRFRKNLKTAGVDRPQLFEKDDVRRHICLHDLRASFVTIALAEGRNEAWITTRTGHHSSEMIHNYMRPSRTHAELNLGPLAPLVHALPELRGLLMRHASPTAGPPARAGYEQFFLTEKRNTYAALPPAPSPSFSADLQRDSNLGPGG